MNGMLRYVKLSPSGNTTAIIADAVDADTSATLSQRLMEMLGVEQVGYYTEPCDPSAGGRLQMMGGEFCGNATRCFAAWLFLGGMGLWQDGVLAVDAPGQLSVEVSGHSGILRTTVGPGSGPLSLQASTEMPVPVNITHGDHRELGDYSAVVFEGITHIVLWDTSTADPPEEAALSLAAEIGVSGDYGIMFADPRRHTLTPLVYIAQVGSKVWESSCGSGSVAVASALADKESRTVADLELIQPGGSLWVTAHYDSGKIVSAQLYGSVELVSYGYVSAGQTEEEMQ